MRCKNCHYPLKALRGPEYRCPECGRAFDPDDPATYETDFSVEDRTGREILCCFGFALLMMVTCSGVIDDPMLLAIGALLAAGLAALVLFGGRSR